MRLPFLALCCLCLAPQAHAIEDRRGPSEGGRIGEDFPAWTALPDAARRLLSRAVLAADPAREPTGFPRWVAENEDFAAAFLSLTVASSRLWLRLSESEELPLSELFVSVERFAGDRTYVRLDVERMRRWRQAGAGFRIDRADGKQEEGSMEFGRGGIGGSLHQGFDVQAYTSAKRVPRLQINYREADGLADLDLDYVAPLKWGVIPNPNHLTWHNSDVRDHFESFVKKFGDPGFRVRRIAESARD